jgi:hypothetical protein
MKEKKGKGPAALPRWVVTRDLLSEKTRKKEEQHRIVTRAASGIYSSRSPSLLSLSAWLAHKKESPKKGTEEKKRTSPTEQGEGPI